MKFINNKKFVKMALDKNFKSFALYIAVLKTLIG